MNTHTNSTTYTARRTYKGAKAIVTLYADGVAIGTAGGKRAERANAVIVTKWASNEGAGIYGLRGDADAAYTEATRISTPRPIIAGGRRGNRRPIRAADGSVCMTNAPEFVASILVAEG